MVTKLTLISRSYCHLCHEMEFELRRITSKYACELEVIDVDACPDLLVLYDELVPVLLHQGKELCHYFLDDTKVRDLLSEIG